MLRTVIVDDSPRSRAALRRLLAAHDQITIVGEAGNVADARDRVLTQLDYDLVLLDIQLIGGSGFDLVPSIKASAHIIFATAYEEHAVRAFEINALDYLLKPITAERLAQALSRVNPSPSAPAERPRPGAAPLPSDTLFVPTVNGSRFIALPDLIVISSEQNYTRLTLTNGVSHLVYRTMKEWEAVLPPDTFVRVHRQKLINLSRLTRIGHDLLGRPQLHLADLTEPISPSRRQWHDIQLRLKG